MNDLSPAALETTSPPTSSPPRERPKTSSRGKWFPIFLILLFAAGGWYAWTRYGPPAHSKAAAASPPQQPGSRGRTGGTPAVEAVKATKGNIGVYLTGLGTVTPINTVTIRSRVDGQLMKVHYTEGQLVHQGDPLVDIDPRPFQVQLDQFEGQLMRDRAVLENAKVDVTRYQQLIGHNAVPEQTLATQKSTVSQDEGSVKADQAQIDSAKLNLDYCHIVAPITGRLGLRLVDTGNYIQSGAATPLAVITQVDPISVIFTISEDQLSPVLQKTRSGQELTVAAYDRELNQHLANGKLTTIDNQIDQTTGTVKLRAVFDNPTGALFANQFVNARLLIQEKRGVTLLPGAAIQRNAQSTYVYVIKPDQTVTIRNVVTGVSDNDVTEVTSGVAPGDVIATTGVDRLQEGSRVNATLNNPPATRKGR